MKILKTECKSHEVKMAPMTGQVRADKLLTSGRIRGSSAVRLASMPLTRTTATNSMMVEIDRGSSAPAHRSVVPVRRRSLAGGRTPKTSWMSSTIVMARQLEVPVKTGRPPQAACAPRSGDPSRPFSRWAT